MKHFLLLSAILLSFTNKAQCTIQYTVSDSLLEPGMIYAKNHIEPLLTSSVPIKINLRFTNNLGSNTLGLTLANGEKDFVNAPVANTWYPSALANSIAGTELNPGEFDIEVFINENFNWYFDTNTNTPSGQDNFVETLLHEIGHGLGVYSTSLSLQDIGSFGKIDENGLDFLNPAIDLPALEGHPSIYDRFITDNDGNYVTDTNLFPNESAILHDKFTSFQLYFSGTTANYVNNKTRNPKIHAPVSYTFGVSVIHLDNPGFFTIPSVMSPFGIDNQITYDLLTLAVFKDIGWTVNEPVLSVIDLSKNKPVIYPNPTQSELTIDNVALGSEMRLFDITGKQLLHKKVNGLSRINTTELTPGIYNIVIQSEQSSFTKKIIKQ